MASVSSVSVQKPTDRRKSCETVCSSNSSCFLLKRKPVHPLACSIRTPATRNGGNVGQRVLSAKLLKLRSIQNQLNDANFHLSELTRENRALKTLQKRQDKALAKYEGENADLPKILLAHEEEVRVFNERNKSLRKIIKDLNEQLKLREEELLSARDQLKYLTNLSKEKNLGEREKLKEEVETLKEQLEKSNNEVNLLNRKLMLETKNSKYRLNTEISRHKHTQRELRSALLELERIGEASDNDLKDRRKGLNRKKVSLRLPEREVVSMVSLHQKPEPPDDSEHSNETEGTSTSDVTNKLEQLTTKSSMSTILKPPMDSVMARLSVNSLKEFDQLSSTVERMSLANGNKASRMVHTISSRPTSAQKLDQLDAIIQSSIKKTVECKESTESDVLVGKYCSKMVSSVRTCNDTVIRQRENLEVSKNDTEKIKEKVDEIDKLHVKLKKESSTLLHQPMDETSEESELVNQILQEEVLFQAHVLRSEENAKKYENFLLKNTDRNGNLTKNEKKVAPEEKRKLLNTLKAIDNGENVEFSVSDGVNRKANLMHELFGDVGN